MIDPLDEVRGSLHTFYRWFQGVKGTLPRQNAQQWDRQFKELESKLDRQVDAAIAMVGSTGAGKSSLLNAILGQRILPVSTMKPCTAVVTTVRHHHRSEYRAEISFLTTTEWEQELLLSVIELERVEGDEETSGESDWEQISKATKDKITAVYRLDADKLADISDILSHPIPDDLLPFMDAANPQRKVIVATEIAEFKSALEEYLKGEGYYWPLIKCVDIQGPFSVLRDGASLIDLPGVNDPNEAREQVTKNYLTDAPFVWVTFNMKRGITKDIVELMSEQRMLRQLLFDGKVNALTLVGTHADDFDPVTAADELRLPEDAETIQILRKRNRCVKEQVRQELDTIALNMGTHAAEGGEALQRLRDTLQQTKIFTVTTPAYMKLKGFPGRWRAYEIDDIDDTEFPALIDHLKAVSREHSPEAQARIIKKQLNLLVEEIRGFFRNRRSQLEDTCGEFAGRQAQIKERLVYPRRKLGEDVEKECDRIEKRFEERRTEFAFKVSDAATQASRQVDRSLNFMDIHWCTLRAVVVRGGRYRSPSTGRSYDINETIAEPLSRAIPFIWDDFFGKYLRELIANLREDVTADYESFLQALDHEARGIDGYKEEDFAIIAEDVEKANTSFQFYIDDVQAGIERTIERVRRQLWAAIPATIEQEMTPAYQSASNESGKGMKLRMNDTIQSHARQSATEIFLTIQHDIVEGLQELGVQFRTQLGDLKKSVTERADLVMASLGFGEVGAVLDDTSAALQQADDALEFLNDFLSEETVQVAGA